MIIDAALEACKTMGQEQEKNAETAKAELEAAGMVFNVADQASFQAKVQPVYDEFFKTHDKKYFDAIKAAVQ